MAGPNEMKKDSTPESVLYDAELPLDYNKTKLSKTHNGASQQPCECINDSVRLLSQTMAAMR